MRKVATLTLVVGLVSLISSQALAYTWYEYGGHSYAVTETCGENSDGYGTWDECEAEAVGIGGHLVTINDAQENSWLPATFSDALNAHPLGFLWIGLYQPPGSPEPDEGWIWASGEPVTFVSWYGLEPNDQAPGEDYAVLEKHLDPVEWNDWGPEKYDYCDTQGIIEIVPEPSTLLLLAMVALLLAMATLGALACAWRRKSTA